MSCGSLNTYRNRRRNSLVLQYSNVSRRCNCHGEIANSVDPDQTAPLGLQCLQRPICFKYLDV